MSARARRLTQAGVPAMTVATVVLGCAALLTGCGGLPGTSSRPPTRTPTVVIIPTPTPTPQIVGTTRTVLSPLGLRIHSAPLLESSNVVGGFSQGRQFTVLQYQSGGGGWYKVQGQTLGGWIVADPTLTAEGTYNLFAESNGVTALYPQTWGFQNESFGTLFVPQQGSGQSIVLEIANSLASFGAPGLPGYMQSSSTSALVCGYTGTLSYYAKEASYSGATPPALPVSREPLYAEVRFKIDASHAMLIGFNYQNSSQLDVFSALYNSLSFPFPLCEAPAAATTPTPKP
jgi:hypothetical protein